MFGAAIKVSIHDDAQLVVSFIVFMCYHIIRNNS